MSHITGGGFIENLPRVLPDGLGCDIDIGTWELPPVFWFLMRHGNIAPLEMARTFNNGIGMVLIVGTDHVQDAIRAVQAAGEPKVYVIGEVIGEPGVNIHGLKAWSF